MALRGGLGSGGSGKGLGNPGNRKGNVTGLNNTLIPQNGNAAPQGVRPGMEVLSGKEILNVVLLPASLIFGIIGAVGACCVYDMLVVSLYRPITIMLTIGVFFAIVGLANIIYHCVKGVYSPKFSVGKAFVIFAGGLAAVLLLSVMFEFIYELGGGFKNAEAGAYAIIIDDSGSMDDSDPGYARYDAIDIILKDRADDFPYTVYRFSDQTELIRELLPKSDGNQIERPYNGGGTSIKGALETVLDDYKNGNLKNAENLKVLLLSDGVATDINFFSSIDKVLREYSKNNIAISTVGLGNYVDEDLMTKIAKSTGGVYLNVTDISNLANTMTVAIESYSKRDLLTYRSVLGSNILFIIERVLFMGIIGAVIGAVLAVLANGRKLEVSLLIAVIKGFVAAVVLEFFINSFGMNERFIDYCYFVIIAVIVSWLFKGEMIPRPYPVQSDPNEGNRPPLDPEKVFGQKGKARDHSGPKTLGR